jgi:hypothetical protein
VLVQGRTVDRRERGHKQSIPQLHGYSDFFRRQPELEAYKKRLLTAYNNFLTVEMPRIRADNPHLVTTEVMKQAAESWNKLPEVYQQHQYILTSRLPRI